MIELWDWQRDPVPDARVVVCRPGLFRGADGDLMDRALVAMDGARAEGVVFVVPDTFEDHVASAHASDTCIPALYAEDNSGLARVSALLAVQAERRALVLCPRESLDLRAIEVRANGDRMLLDVLSGDVELLGSISPSCTDSVDAVDLVAIIPPPEARTCGACGGGGVQRSEVRSQTFDIAACSPCGGSGRVEPWPMHPLWIRSIVEQCRAAGGPVSFLGWGPWAHKDQLPFEPVDWMPHDQLGFYNVGCALSGRKLDCAEVMDLPDWIVQ